MSLGGSSPYTSTDKIKPIRINIHKRNNTKTQYSDTSANEDNLFRNHIR